MGDLWNGVPSCTEVMCRFLEFKCMGPKIASMAANLLSRIFKIKFADNISIDISPDRHILLMFPRLWLIENGASREALIYRARAPNPCSPGIFDSVVWEIGREWCKTRPRCVINVLWGMSARPPKIKGQVHWWTVRRNKGSKKDKQWPWCPAPHRPTLLTTGKAYCVMMK